MKKKLFMGEPSNYVYNIEASIFSMVQNPIDIKSWIANNFIQIEYVQSWNSYFFDNHHMLIYQCPFIQYGEIDRDLLKDKWDGDIIRFIIEMINKEKYVYLFLEYKLLNSVIYETIKNSFIHEIFVYGYDTDSEVIYCANNMNKGTYECFKITFNEIKLSYWEIRTPWEKEGCEAHFFTSLRTLKYAPIKVSDYKINVNQIRFSLERYLNSLPSCYMNFDQDIISGIDAIYVTLNQIKESISNKNTCKLDRRAFHLFYIHKKFMVMRLKYLNEEGVITNQGNIFDDYVLLENDFLILRSLVLKYNISPRLDVLNKVEQKFETCLKEEKRICEKLLSTLPN
jgi:hypothetical protein|nr:hypothetical protein [uncultured Lachnoclostridium sp.]